MKVRTFMAYLPELDIAFDQKKLDQFQKTIDDIVGSERNGIVLYHTPYNPVTSFTVGLWALGRTEKENREIMDKARTYLGKENIRVEETCAYVIWNEGKFYTEIKNEDELV